MWRNSDSFSSKQNWFDGANGRVIVRNFVQFQSLFVNFLLFFFFPIFSEESEGLARNLGVRLFRTSVKEDLNVAGVFRYLATNCHELIKQQYNTVLPLSAPTISQFSPTFHSKSNGTIILTRPLKKSSKKKNMLKKCGIIWAHQWKLKHINVKNKKIKFMLIIKKKKNFQI